MYVITYNSKKLLFYSKLFPPQQFSMRAKDTQSSECECNIWVFRLLHEMYFTSLHFKFFYLYFFPRFCLVRYFSLCLFVQNIYIFISAYLKMLWGLGIVFDMWVEFDMSGTDGVEWLNGKFLRFGYCFMNLKSLERP